MRKWKRDGYTVREVPFDHDLHHFEVVTDDGEHVGTIQPDSVEDMERIAADLDAGADVHGWEDGMGGIIAIPGR